MILIVLALREYAADRVEICCDRHDRRSCKICASCVIFSRKQCAVLQNLRGSAGFTLNICDFLHLNC